MTVPYFDAASIARHLGFPRLIEFLATALAEPVVAPLRQRISGIQQRELLVMPVMSTRLAGVKILAVVPANTGSDLPVVGGLFVLLNAQTGVALATMDAGELTARRTAAISALAARQLARSDATTLLMIGAGHLAPYLAEAYCCVRPIRRILVWGRRAAAARNCADRIRKRVHDVEVEVVADLPAAIAESDIVSAATRANDPVIAGDWLRAGTHVDLVGGYRPDMREIDDDGVARASIYVDTLDGALSEAGDLRSPIERGVISEAAILGDLAALLNGAGRASATQITLFKSVGSASSDLAAADLVWQSCHG